jgi:transcriptional regulator with XRE-family HTH domain
MYTHPQQGHASEAASLRREAGRWLKELREAKGLSQRELARSVCVEYYTFISQIESGRGRIPPERYEIWANALGVDVRYFVRTLMSYYDPITYRILFGGDDVCSATSEEETARK